MLPMIVIILVSPHGRFADEIMLLLPAIVFACALHKKYKYPAEILIAINSLEPRNVIGSPAKSFSSTYL